jgi:thiol-disulfide isomerase/thioredoxin
VALEILLVIAIVYSIHWWRTRDLLPDSGLTPAPGFELEDLQGNRWSEESLPGVTVLYFFAPWCGVCNASAHQLRWFHRWSDGVRLVLVALDWNSVDEIREYATRHRLEAPVLIGDAATALRFRIGGYPTYYVISDGRIVQRDFGYTTAFGLWWRSLRIGT